ncbi:MAG: ATP-dependent zinc metalloprotease FtsH [Oscillospiraceae bacterium]|nr:ATP-dependent zinc metalloprotease FtsH [Oscillospiraceae bacterium]
MNKKPKSGIGFYILILLALVVMAVALRTPTAKQTEKYSVIMEYFEEKQVSEFTLDLGSGELELALKDKSAEKITYKVPYVQLFMTQLIDENGYLAQYEAAGEKITYDFIPAAETPWWYSMIPSVLLLIGLGVFWFFMFNQAGGGGGKIMNVGKARVKNEADDKRKTTFKDVAGADEEKEELQEIVEFLKNPNHFNALGARIPRGVLLVGPPGTGKTLLARACAGEAGVPFYSISGSDFVEMYVGVGASRVRDLFEKAKKSAPAIVFIDEIDAVGRQRGTGLGGGHDEREQTLNQLLVEMDGFGANEGVIVIAATNRADILDKALLRPGRFDRQVYVGLPDVKGREEILQVHTRNKPIGPDVELKTIAKTTVGFTGADLENLVNEAALLAARRGRKAIVETDIEEATIKVMAGPEKKSRVITEKEKRLTAYHEAGHAITGYYSPTGDPVHEISIIPRGPMGGYTMYLPEDDSRFQTKRQMEERLVSMLGGRVAEKIVLEDISTGASNDLERATDIARGMVMRYGFSERLGPVVYGGNPNETFLGRDFGSSRNYSEAVASEIDSEIRDILDEAFEIANKCLTEHRQQLEIVAKELMEREKLSGEEFKLLMEGGTLPAFEGERKLKTPEEKAAEYAAAEKAATEQAAKEQEETATEEIQTDTEVLEEAVQTEETAAQQTDSTPEEDNKTE